MENLQSSYVLSNNERIPVMGYGCYKAEGSELIAAADYAASIGYSLFDSAAYYNNEKELGEALKKCSVPREKLFIVSKIWPSEFPAAAEALDRTLRDLGLDYLDAYLLHWPGLDEKKRDSAIEALLLEKGKGKIRVLGVSNFLEAHLERFHDQFGFWPPINQIEVHPYFQQRDLCDFCKKHDIRVMAYSPLGRGKGFDNSALTAIAEACNKSVPQVMLRWQIQKKYIPVPKSILPARIKANADIFDFVLTPEQMSRIDALNLPGGEGRVSKDPLVFPEV